VVKAEAPRGLDLMFDCVGQNYLTQAIGIMRQRTGQIVTIVNPQGQLDAGYRRNVTIHYEFLQRSGWALELLATLIDRGQIDVHIDEVFPLAEVAQAHRKLEAGGVKGKIVLEVA
jgi:NADPH:quinone reductase-like Zn-dependent oxidoreductase